ncbi:hypothetical protein Cgig2_003641 [Carnegiea gigantea]|uniref:Uncharacterized protein n=1 Tax=Carnegiea gigantea TaxID=171969 RepID=A0A9Q1JJ10_9CARY|nr:hypothetical protein Cgig2_003641 [Carnegiea gigantea]
MGQALVGGSAGEEQLFSLGSILSRSGSTSELDFYLQKLKEYGIFHSLLEIRSSPRSCRFQVLDALVNLFCRTDISVGTLWDGGWLLRQLLPYSEEEFNREHIKLLRESYNKCSSHILVEATGTWADFLVSHYGDWCLEDKVYSDLTADVISSESSSAGERMLELVKR